MPALVLRPPSPAGIGAEREWPLANRGRRRLRQLGDAQPDVELLLPSRNPRLLGPSQTATWAAQLPARSEQAPLACTPLGLTHPAQIANFPGAHPRLAHPTPSTRLQSPDTDTGHPWISRLPRHLSSPGARGGGTRGGGAVARTLAGLAAGLSHAAPRGSASHTHTHTHP